MLFESKRLYFREMTEADYAPLCTILQDASVMYAYEHAFSEEEVWDWLNNQLRRYSLDGFGLWAVILKESGEFIGQCGITMQSSPFGQVPEIGYLFAEKYWHNGYASEAAAACKSYAFEKLNFEEVYSIIRDNNFASIRVAQRNGMTQRGVFDKFYYGITMPHLVYSVKKTEF